MTARSPFPGIRRREARIEVRRRHQHAEAIGADQAQAGGARGVLRRFRERPRAMTEPAVMMIAAAAPLAPAAATVSGTAAGGTAITTTSGVPAMASMDLTRADALDISDSSD